MHNNETGASVVNARYVHVHKINNILNFHTALQKLYKHHNCVLVPALYTLLWKARPQNTILVTRCGKIECF